MLQKVTPQARIRITDCTYVLNLLDKSKVFDAGKQIQRLYAGWSDNYLRQLVGF